MAYKAITKKGEEFILNRCLASTQFGNNRFAGKRNFALPKSTLSSDTTFVSSPKDDLNKSITTPEVLAKNLISWFNRYSELYLLDANIIAAQAYAESGYNLWIYSGGGAMGISQFIDAAVFDTILKNKYTFEEDLQNITDGLNGDYKDIRHIIPNFTTGDKKIVSTKDTITIAKQNREILFQNIIDNPDIMIKAQCYLMNFIGGRNNNLAASSLFAYNRGSGLRSTSYDEIIDITTKKFGKGYIKEGIGYVDRIFKLLAGKEHLVPVGFGYDIDFTEATTQNFNISSLVKISGDFPLSQAQENSIQSLHPIAQGIFREFIYRVQKETPFDVQITSAYRTFLEQATVKAKNESYNPARPASSPGNSYHNYGLALDIALESRTVNGLRYSFNKSVSEWRQTGVPNIATSLNLRWGGTFNDQVHFDLGNVVPSVFELKSIAINTYGSDPANIEGNQIPLSA